ncbi:hypothetical protein KL918_005118 [Ogataea parapolymorpha]|uniref:ATPase synthesis protein 25 n=1 Tax=Ogataea parapolymorpha (strain ATCC 26012 / BCRC 20466 / JCM 22074 / NRRL Y-7560 / DL-1) TaxID=871575 RepID=W1QI88_OGAPD|nr:putative secreted protein [Ogataea parapolymorpha DL-1]ESX02070.1 putative secreted protein [Ogataea parapolymorpha DL-1]KAG7864992.1 hypothetical protein KL918_005118 [Ogataea parapolymorpha]KAG7871505.1 hypothetical protein KL916_003856 [Ogataea parapolymorpha]
MLLLCARRALPTLCRPRVRFGVRLNSSDAPWYLRQTPQKSAVLNQTPLPELPANSPDTLQPLLEFVAQKLGMTDIEVFDLRGADSEQTSNEGAQEVADFMIIATGKSSKHLQKATFELNFYVKHQLKSLSTHEGLLTTGQLAKFRRRLLKRGKKGPSYAMNNYGAEPNTWVMVDCKKDNIFVHFMTPERRAAMNLEALWAKDKEKYENRAQPAEDDSIFSGFRFMHTMRRPMNAIQVLTQLSRFSRSSSTETAGRFQQLKEQHLADPASCPLDRLENHLKSKQANGRLVTAKEISKLVEVVLQSAEFHEGLETDTAVFNKRYARIFSILETFSPVLTEKDIQELLPVLVVAGSQIDADGFVTLASTTQDSDVQFRYSPMIHKLYNLCHKLYQSRKDAAFVTKMDLLFLTIFANRGNWVYMKKVLEAALQREDFVPVQAALKFLSINGTSAQCLEFVDNYLPYLKLWPSFDASAHKTELDTVLAKAGN